jgi:hypothetical protein
MFSSYESASSTDCRRVPSPFPDIGLNSHERGAAPFGAAQKILPGVFGLKLDERPPTPYLRSGRSILIKTCKIDFADSLSQVSYKDQNKDDHQ